MMWLVALMAQVTLSGPPAPPADAPADQAPVTEAAAPAEAQTEAAPPAEARRRCYRISETGSNRYRRVCYTDQSRDAEQDARVRDEIRRSTSRGGTNNVCAQECPMQPGGNPGTGGLPPGAPIINTQT